MKTKWKTEKTFEQRLSKFSLKRFFIVGFVLSVFLILVMTIKEIDLWESENVNPYKVQTYLENHDNLSSNVITPSNLIDKIQKEEDPGETENDEETFDVANMSSRPWYFSKGKRYPKPAKVNSTTTRRIAKLIPSEDDRGDRITDQLMFVPSNYEDIKREGRLKTILLYNGLAAWKVKPGRSLFKSEKCPVDTCQITSKVQHAKDADLIVFKDHYIPTGVAKQPRQLYMLYYLESPSYTRCIKFPNVFNWTSTYRRDSDIVAPYKKWEYFDRRVQQRKQDRNYAQNKTKKVAWFVTNCKARNNRLQFARELAKYIQVDIYGKCGSSHCSRKTAGKCFDILDRDYKFYLAFENSNCRDYITEKFFVNGLSRATLPIMGASPEEYEMIAPERSFIHVDEFGSAKELADYLHFLDKDDELYNSYFKWKGTGEFIDTHFWCRVCSILHDEDAISQPKWYEDINDWWRGDGVCVNDATRNFQAFGLLTIYFIHLVLFERLNEIFL